MNKSVFGILFLFLFSASLISAGYADGGLTANERHSHSALDIKQTLNNTIQTAKPNTNSSQRKNLPLLLNSMFAGSLLTMILYGGFQFITIRDTNYGLFSLLLLFEVLAFLQLDGFYYHYLWSDSPLWNGICLPIFFTGLIISQVIFSRSILNIINIAPRYSNLLSAIAVVAALAILYFYLTGTLDIAYIMGVALLSSISLSLISAVLWIQGSRTVALITIGWTALGFSLFILLLVELGIIIEDFITQAAVKLGVILEALLLSTALGSRIHLEKQAKIFAQKALTETQRQANRTVDHLERRIQDHSEKLDNANKKLRMLNTQDAATGLRNRRFFNSYLSKEYTLACQSQQPIAIFLVNIDKLKYTNNQFGNYAGDGCIIAVANTLTSQVRAPSDAIARYGSDEFAIILTNTDNEKSSIIAERIRSSVEDLRIQHKGKTISLTVSVGVYCEIPTAQSSHEDAIDLTEMALRKAKEEGRNRVTFANAL